MTRKMYDIKIVIETVERVTYFPVIHFSVICILCLVCFGFSFLVQFFGGINLASAGMPGLRSRSVFFTSILMR